MAKKNGNSLNSVQGWSLFGVVLFLLLAIYLFKTGKFNINSDASRSKYVAVGTFILSSSSPACDPSYTYSLVNSGYDQCTSLVVNTNDASMYLDENVQLKGAYKDSVFYVNSVKVIGNSNMDGSRTPKPTMSSYPMPSPKPIKYSPRPEPTIEVPPPADYIRQ